MLLSPPQVTYGVDGRPTMARQFGDAIRVHRPPRFARSNSRTAQSLCTVNTCDGPAVIDRTTGTVSNIESWRAICREHALSHADRLGPSLGAVLREMIPD